MLSAVATGGVSASARAAAPDWEWQNPLPQGDDLHAVWGSGPSDVFAVGGGGRIMRYNGLTWSLMDSGTSEILYGVWGSGPSDVFAVGGTESSPSHGAILHYDGASWTTMAGPAGEVLRAVWGSASDDVFAVGDYGLILHYDGSTWTQMNDVPGSDLRAVWGTGPANVYAAGVHGGAQKDSEILHYGGSSWSTVSDLPQAEFNALWGMGPTEIWAAGSGADWMWGGSSAISRYDGSHWSAITGPQIELLGIWGSGPNNVYAVAYREMPFESAVYRYDGSAWTTAFAMPSKGTSMPPLNAIWGSGPADIFAVGDRGTILHYDGANWSTMTTGPTEHLGAIWGSGASDIYAVTGVQASETIILNYDGSTWSQVTTGSDAKVRAIWGSAWDDVFAVGYQGRVLHYDGSVITEMTRAPGQDSTILAGVWGSGPGDVFAVDELSGKILHYDGEEWSILPYDFKWSFEGVWGTGPSDVFAFGGMIYPPNKIAHIVHYDGTAWSEMDIGTVGGKVYGVWGTAPNDVFAVGSAGAILHYDGATWTPMTKVTTKDLRGIWGRASDDIYAVGGGFWPGSVILHYDGENWTPMSNVTGQTLHALWGTSTGSKEVFAVGDAGTILHHAPMISAVYLPDLTIDVGDLSVRPPPAAWVSSLGRVDIAFDQPVSRPGWFGQVTLTAVANPGALFSHWEGNPPAGHEMDNPLSLTMAGDLTLTPVFAQASPDGSGWGAPCFPSAAPLAFLLGALMLDPRRNRSRSRN